MGRGGKRAGAGRPKGARDKVPRSPQHAYEALDVLVDIVNNSESDVARVSAAEKILNRVLGKAPEHIDTGAIKHTEIVYRSVEEIRAELQRLLIDKVTANDEADGAI